MNNTIKECSLMKPFPLYSIPHVSYCTPFLVEVETDEFVLFVQLEDGSVLQYNIQNGQTTVISELPCQKFVIQDLCLLHYVPLQNQQVLFLFTHKKENYLKEFICYIYYLAQKSFHFCWTVPITSKQKNVFQIEHLVFQEEENNTTIITVAICMKDILLISMPCNLTTRQMGTLSYKLIENPLSSHYKSSIAFHSSAKEFAIVWNETDVYWYTYNWSKTEETITHKALLLDPKQAMRIIALKHLHDKYWIIVQIPSTLLPTKDSSTLTISSNTNKSIFSGNSLLLTELEDSSSTQQKRFSEWSVLEISESDVKTIATNVCEQKNVSKVFVQQLFSKCYITLYSKLEHNLKYLKWDCKTKQCAPLEQQTETAINEKEELMSSQAGYQSKSIQEVYFELEKKNNNPFFFHATKQMLTKIVVRCMKKETASTSSDINNENLVIESIKELTQLCTRNFQSLFKELQNLSTRLERVEKYISQSSSK